MAFVRFALHLELRNILLVQFVVSSYSVMWNSCNKNTTKFWYFCRDSCWLLLAFSLSSDESVN